MSKQVAWTKDLVGRFISDALLTEDEAFILVTRVKGWTVTKQAMELHCSEQRVHKLIALLKKKYDVVQAEKPDVYPVRRASAKETYMDTH